MSDSKGVGFSVADGVVVVVVVVVGMVQCHWRNLLNGLNLKKKKRKSETYEHG